MSDPHLSSNSSGFSGFFQRFGASNAAAPQPSQGGHRANSPPPQDAADLTAENRKLKEIIQKMEVEKMLLKDLVDKAYGGDDDVDDPAALAAAKKALLNFQEEKAAMSVQVEAAEAALRGAEKECKMQAKRATVFEAEVKRLQGELKEADATLSDMRKVEAERDGLAEKARRLQAELSSTQETVTAMMAKVSDADRVKHQTERDLTAIVEKTANATNATQEDLSRKSELLSAAQQEVVRLRAALGKLEADGATAVATAAVTAAANSELAAAKAEVFRLTDAVRDWEAKYNEACTECESLHKALDSEEESAAAMRRAMEEALANSAKSSREAEKASLELETVRGELADANEAVTAGQRDCNAVQNAMREMRLELEQAHGNTDMAQRELAAAVQSMEDRQAAWEEEKEALLKQIDELTEKVADADTQTAIKLRMANTKVKELQAQLT
jgi:chromosome segregation ATPase